MALKQIDRFHWGEISYNSAYIVEVIYGYFTPGPMYNWFLGPAFRSPWRVKKKVLALKGAW